MQTKRMIEGQPVASQPPAPNEAAFLNAWQAHLRTVMSKPWLASSWLTRSSDLVQRFTRTYEHLRQQPRHVRRRIQRQWGASLAGAALALALLNAPAYAASITVDGTTCTLVDAITAANTDAAVGGCAAGSGADIITLQSDVTLTASNIFRYNDNNGLPVINSTITIEGAGHIISRDAGAPAFRLLTVASSGNLTLHQTTLSNGNVTNGGGGIFNRGTATVSNSTLSGNTSSIQGGGIFSSGTLTVSNSTLSGNTATRGGGIYNDGGTLTVSNSTLSGNTGSDYGGGIYNNAGTLNLAHSLISGNSAGNHGAEIYNYNGTVNAANFNLVGYSGAARSFGFTPSGSDIVPSQALAAILNPTLANNGGGTLTLALVTGSPAIDAAGGSGLIATDQRGITRPQGAADDIGAFELEPPPPPPVNARLNGTDCNLIDAIIAANTDTATGACVAGTAGADTITLLSDVTLRASNNYTYSSDTGLPIISSAITIEGAGHTIQRDAGAGAFRLLAVAPTGNLTLHQTTLSRGNSSRNGGAIYNEGTLTVNNSTLSGNTAGSGGAIYTYGGTLTVSNSTLSGNTASDLGGAIFTYRNTHTVSNSTLSGNTASNKGGAIYNKGTLTVSNSTLAANSASYGGGILNKGTLTLARNLISGNTASSGGAEIDKKGTINSNTNLWGDSSKDNAAAFRNFTPDASDITATSDGTKPTALAAILNTTLANNGGDTLTHAPVAGSPAIDAAGGSGLITTDQRGITRPQGAADDIGAFELEKVNANLGLQGSPTTAFNATPDGTFGSQSPAGVFTITATFRNTANPAVNLHDVYFVVTQIHHSNGDNYLLSADNPPGQVGATQSVANSAFGGDNLWNHNEDLPTTFRIGLTERRRFAFFVDVYGISSAVTAAGASTTPQLIGHFTFTVAPNEADGQGQTLFLPLVAR